MPFSKGAVYFHTPLVCMWATEFWQAVSSYRNSLWTLFLDWLLNILVVVGGETSFAIFFSSLLPIWGGNVTLSVGYAHGRSTNQSGLNVNVRDVLKKYLSISHFFHPPLGYIWFFLLSQPFMFVLFLLVFTFSTHTSFILIPHCFPPSVFVQHLFHSFLFCHLLSMFSLSISSFFSSFRPFCIFTPHPHLLLIALHLSYVSLVQVCLSELPETCQLSIHDLIKPLHS